MKLIINPVAALSMAIALLCASCNKATAADPAPTTTTDTMTTNIDTTGTKVRIEISMGTFTVLLYNDTPIHRDNFVKLASEGYYNGTLFHRVINQFMVQAGDPASKTAQPGQMLGSGDPGYTLEAEIRFPQRFHKRYTLAAARTGDQVNPERRSSGSQFYVVTGTKVPEAALPQLQARINNSMAQSIFNGLAQQHMDEIRAMQAAGDQAGLKALQDKLVAETEAQIAANPFTLTPEMKKAYAEVGGAPHLDGQYTVFGEVIEGMEVIDNIEKVETDRNDRPTTDIRIISTTVIPAK